MDVIEQYRKIDLDPCGAPNSLVNAYRQYLLENGEDGLKLPWDSFSYWNPPYGREIVDWVNKAIHEYNDRHVESIGLVPSRTDTKWFKACWEHATGICFWYGRIKFIGEDTRKVVSLDEARDLMQVEQLLQELGTAPQEAEKPETTTAPFPSALIWFGDERYKNDFNKIFSRIGAVRFKP